jgi:hypothetical protein
MLRVRRDGPLVPARLRWLDHAPDDPPENRLDRGRLSIVTVAEIAGAGVPPEEVTDRRYRGPGHWKYAEPITESEYRYQLARLDHAQRIMPRFNPRRRLKPADLPLPNFDRENA